MTPRRTELFGIYDHDDWSPYNNLVVERQSRWTWLRNIPFHWRNIIGRRIRRTA